jgi:hypothetical protein
MTMTDQFLQALQAYREIRDELRSPDQPSPEAEIQSPLLEGKLPEGSLLLGLAEDGLPLVFDLYEPASGPILVVGDGGSGKTALLQHLARNSNLLVPGDVQFGVLTPFPEEWRPVESLPNCLGIWPVYHTTAKHFLSQLVAWAKVLPETRQVVLLLVDGLDLLAASGERLLQPLRWLLQYGPERQVWPVVSLNPGRLPRMQTWLEYFQTFIFSQVKQPQIAGQPFDVPGIDLANLQPGSQFGLARGSEWLKFRIPSAL